MIRKVLWHSIVTTSPAMKNRSILVRNAQFIARAIPGATDQRVSEKSVKSRPTCEFERLITEKSLQPEFSRCASNEKSRAENLMSMQVDGYLSPFHSNEKSQRHRAVFQSPIS